MNVMMTKQIGFYFAIVVLFGVLEKAPAQERVIRDYGCLYGVEGSCVPRRTTYGYYETHWRNWPYAQPARISVKRQKRTFPFSGSTELPEAEVPRLKDEASIRPELPHKPEELAPYVPRGLREQIEMDRQTDPFEDDLQTPAAGVPRNDGQSNPFEDDLQTPAVEPPADDSGAMRLQPRGFYPTRLAPNSASILSVEMRQPQNGRYNPLRGSFERAKPVAVTTNRVRATQAVALEEVESDPWLKRAFPSPQVNSRHRAAVSNPLRR